MNIINSLPQHITADPTGVDASGNVVAVIPDSMDYSVSDPTLGTIVADPGNPNGATFTPAAGALGDVTFSAVSHQAGLADFTLTPVTGTLVAAPVPGVQITAGSLALDPQAVAKLRVAKK